MDQASFKHQAYYQYQNIRLHNQRIIANSCLWMQKYKRIFFQQQVLIMYIEQKDIGNEALMKMSEYLIKKHLLLLLRKSLGALTFETRNGIGKGTAVLISGNLILTCAHNIYDKVINYAYTNFKFYLAVHGDSTHYYEIETYRFMEQFATCESRQRLRFDFALMKLKEDIERPIKLPHFLKLDILCRQCQASKFKLSIYGYSSSCSYQEQHVEAQQGAEDRIISRIYQYGLTQKGRLKEINLQEKSLKYQMTTHPGQSGCPVVSNNNIIGIHVGGGAGMNDYNIGKMIAQEMIDNMRVWRAEMEAESFEVHQHCHQVRYENKKLIIQQGKVKQKIVLEYNQHKHLTVQKILSEQFKNAKRYQCLIYKSTVLFPQDTLDKIQSEPLFSNQQISLRFLKGSARLHFYRVVLKQYQDTSISNQNQLINQLMSLRNKETQKNAYIRKVIDFYSKYYFYQMNKTLRAYDFAPKSEMLQMATELINACSLLPKSFNTQVYRGVCKDYKNSLQQGQIVQFGEFLSTSKDRDEAYKHTLRNQGATLFTFKSTNGSILADNYQCAGKQVIMHLPFSNFIVERTFKQEKEKINYADLAQIAGPITYRKDIIIWICNRPENCEKEWSNWTLSGQIEVIHVPSVRFFRDAWLPVYGWILGWKQVRLRILLYENSGSIWDSLSRSLSRQQSLDEQKLGLLEYLRWERDDWTGVLFYTNIPNKYEEETDQRGLYRNFWASSNVEYVNRFVQFSNQTQDPSESRQ